MTKERLDSLVYQKGLVGSREKASRLILAGLVLVNNRNATKPGMRYDIESKIRLKKKNMYVSRGGLKIEKINKDFYIDFKNKVVVDVGASTGGFSDYSLKNGAKKVYAIDVGYGQLAQKLRDNEKVISMERTDIRNVDKFSDKIDIFLIDVSFISLKKILPKIKEIIIKQDHKADIIALVKPQFEVGKAVADRFKGIIKDETIRKKALDDIISFSGKEGFASISRTKASLKGAKGNQEYLLYLRYPKKIITFGVFDCFHEGHKFLLAKAGEKDNLLVILPSDNRVKKIKGNEPINNLEQRLSNIKELGYKVEMEKVEPWDNIIEAKADIIVLGYDQHWANLIDKKIKESKYLVRTKKIKESFSSNIYKSRMLRDK